MKYHSRMRPKKKCKICSELISGNNYSNHVKSHSVPEIQCNECDYRAHFPSIIEYHYQRKHVYQVKQGRPLKNQSASKNKPRIFTKKVLAEHKNKVLIDEQNNGLPSTTTEIAKRVTKTKRMREPIFDELRSISGQSQIILQQPESAVPTHFCCKDCVVEICPLSKEVLEAQRSTLSREITASMQMESGEGNGEKVSCILCIFFDISC